MGKSKQTNWDLSYVPQARRVLFKAEMARAAIPAFCEALHTKVQEIEGMVFYYWQQLSSGVSIIRYEWDVKILKKREPLRVGIIVNITRNPLKDAIIYVTTREAYVARAKTPPTLDVQAEQAALESIQSVLTEAHYRTTPQAQKTFYIVKYVELLAEFSYTDYAASSDGLLTICPTVGLLKNKILDKKISAIVLSVSAPSLESAKDRVSTLITRFCALATLAHGVIVKDSHVRWPRPFKPVEFVTSLPPPPIGQLYPKHQRIILHPSRLNTNKQDMVISLWQTFGILSPAKQEAFLQSILAYYAGLENLTTQPTLAIVAFTAVLSSLAEGGAKKCPGKLSCSQCGSLDWKHNLQGEAIVIVNRIAELLKLNKDTMDRLSELIKRVYTRQRSAFVHGALLRHGERNKNDSLQGLIPSETDLVSDVFQYRQDLLSMMLLARKALLAELASASAQPLHQEIHSDVFDGKITLVDQYSISIKLKSKRPAQIRVEPL